MPAAANARGINRKVEPLVLRNPKQAKQNKAEARARAEALRPHITVAINCGLMSSNAIVNDLNARHRAT